MGILDDIFGSNAASDEQPLNELDAILLDPSLDFKTRDLARQVKNMESKVARAGIDPELTEPRESLFSQVLDTLDAPRQGVAGIVDAALRGDIFTEGVGTGFRRGQIENTTTSDILRRHDIIDNPIARGVVGFAGDVLTDPLSYLTFGAGAGAKVAGRVLTEGGLATKNRVTKNLFESGLSDVLALDGKVNDVFDAAARYEKHSKRFNEATSESVRALELDAMTKAEQRFSGIIDPSEIKEGLFEKGKLRVGMSLPFLGHLTDDAASQLTKEEVLGDIGIVGQALRSAGKVFKPGRMNIADIELSDSTLKALDNIKDFANEKLGSLGAAFNAVENVPVLGLGVKAGKAGGQALKAANETFKKIFNRKALIGPQFENTTADFINARAVAKQAAQQRAAGILGDDLIANDALQKEIALAIDAQAMNYAQQVIGDNPEFLSVINRIRQTGQVLDGDKLLFKEALGNAQVEQGFRQSVANLMSDPNLRPEVKDGIQRTMGALDELYLEEQAAGVSPGFLETYIPHKYQRLDSGERDAFKGIAKGSFLKERKYASLSEAWQKSGKLGDLNLASLLANRIESSMISRAEKAYFNRMVIEEGLDAGLVASMYKEAFMNPDGEAAKALSRYRINLPDITPEDLIKQAKEGEQLVYDQNIYKLMGQGKTAEAKALMDEASSFQKKTHEELWSSGFKPLDNKKPMSLLGEIGDVVKSKDGADIFLPKPIANAYKETVAAKDLVKEALGGSPIGNAIVNMLDHGTNFFKKMVTLPFPAYWAQNFLGDRFLQGMYGIQGMDPGIFARTHSVLSGKSAIKSVNGITLDPTALKRISQQMGLQYSAKDYLGTIENFGNMDIEKFLAKRDKGALSNLFSLNGKRTSAGLEQLQEKAQRSFDGFFRMSHFVHRFEKGDSIADAARAANDIYFNYRNLTPVEQSLFRRFYMFYGYMSKATKRSLTDLVTQPGNLTMQLHGVNALAETFSDPNAAPTADMHDSRLLRSAVTNEQLSRVVGRTPEGKPIIGRGFSAPLNAVMQQFSAQAPRNFTLSELADTFGDSVTRSIQKQFATSNPAINALAQKISGKNLYFDKPLTSEFLRKLPSLNAAAEKYAGLKADELPFDLDAVTKKFLGAVPDGKGRLIAQPEKMWILMNVIPGLSRATSMAGSFTNADVPLSAALLRSGLGVNIDDADPSRSYLYSRKDELSRVINDYSIDQKLRNERGD